MARKKDKLADYQRKRDFRSTPEPQPTKRTKAETNQPAFVIQKHAASSLHYDFRLEVDGALKSWAVPKGPSTDPRQKRLAIATEDHPLEYADFEGVIPADEYGGGTILVWDWGSYRNLKQGDESRGETSSIVQQIEDGHVNIWLEGKKIGGGYALIRTGGREHNWLLVKMDDERANARRNPTSTQPRSVKSGRTIEEIRAEEDEA